MTTLKNKWLQCRPIIEYALCVPTIVIVAIFTVLGAYRQIQQFAIGFDSAFDAIRWLFCAYGVLVAPILMLRSWSEIFHDGEDAFTAAAIFKSELWGGPFATFERIALASVVILALLGLMTIGRKLVLIALNTIIIVVAGYMKVVCIPVIVIGYTLHAVRAFRDRKARKNASKIQQPSNGNGKSM